jgi:hypothetical protein
MNAIKINRCRQATEAKMTHNPEVKTQAQKLRLTTVKRAGARLNKSSYQILRMCAAGELETEAVDGNPAVHVDSIERYEAAQR